MKLSTLLYEIWLNIFEEVYVKIIISKYNKRSRENNKEGEKLVISGLLYTVKEIMNKQFIKVKENETIKDALNKMIEENKDEVLVIDKVGELIGVFTRKDVAEIKKN